MKNCSVLFDQYAMGQYVIDTPVPKSQTAELLSYWLEVTAKKFQTFCVGLMQPQPVDEQILIIGRSSPFSLG
jgi:hypothetical protein